MAPEQSLAASLHALWLRYETNEAGLHDLGHFLRVHYETISRTLARPEGANRNAIIDECVTVAEKQYAPVVADAIRRLKICVPQEQEGK